MSPIEEIKDEVDGSDTVDAFEQYQTSLKDGYKGLAGALMATTISEAILLLGHVGGEAPLIFALIGLVFSLRHILQIWQAKQQLKQLQKNSLE